MVYADSYRLVDLGITDASSSRNYNTSTLLRLFRLVACSFAYVKPDTTKRTGLSSIEIEFWRYW